MQSCSRDHLVLPARASREQAAAMRPKQSLARLHCPCTAAAVTTPRAARYLCSCTPLIRAAHSCRMFSSAGLQRRVQHEQDVRDEPQQPQRHQLPRPCLSGGRGDEGQARRGARLKQPPAECGWGTNSLVYWLGHEGQARRGARIERLVERCGCGGSTAHGAWYADTRPHCAKMGGCAAGLLAACVHGRAWRRGGHVGGRVGACASAGARLVTATVCMAYYQLCKGNKRSGELGQAQCVVGE